MDVAELIAEARTGRKEPAASTGSWYDPDSAAYDDADGPAIAIAIVEAPRRGTRALVLAAPIAPDPLHGEWG
jgi:hypothetical protein